MSNQNQFKFLNKGISTPVGILIIVLVAVIAGAGILTWQYFGTPKEEVGLLEENGKGGQVAYNEEDIGYGIDSDTSWRILIDPGYGYEIKYPPEKITFGMYGGETAPKRYFDYVGFRFKSESPESEVNLSPSIFDLCVYYPSFQEAKLSLNQFASQIAEGFEKENFQIANQPAVKLTFEKGFLIKGCWWISGGALVDVSENTEVIYLKHPKREVYLIFVIKYSSFDKIDASKTFYEMFSTLGFKNVLASEEDCNKIVKGLERDKCFSGLAKSTRNENYCEKIETYIEAKDSCYLELAYFKDDFSLCEKIKTDNYLTSCEVYFEEVPQSWKIYTDSEAGYQFEYPTDDIIFEIETKEHVRFHWKDRKSYGVYTHFNVKQTTLEEYIAQLDTGYPKWEHLSRYNKITIGGKVAYQSKRGAPAYAFDGRNVYQIQCAGISSRDIDSIYDKMISSFKFIKPTEPEKPYFKILSPNGEEELEIGKTYNIIWNSSGIEKVFIDLVNYSQGDAIPLAIVDNISASLEKYSWTIPSNISSGTKYKILILDLPHSPYFYPPAGSIYDESDNYFSIVKKDKTTN